MKNSNNGFKVPKNYFESFEDTFFEKLNKTTLRDNEYSIPKNYFEDLEDEIISKINFEKKTKVIPISKIIFTIAASLILFFSVYYTTRTNTNLNKITSLAIENWYIDNIEDIDTYTITEIMDNYTINEFQNLNNSEIINQLEEINIENLLTEIN